MADLILSLPLALDDLEPEEEEAPAGATYADIMNVIQRFYIIVSIIDIYCC
jgi:hypothetical protein